MALTSRAAADHRLHHRLHHRRLHARPTRTRAVREAGARATVDTTSTRPAMPVWPAPVVAPLATRAATRTMESATSHSTAARGPTAPTAVAPEARAITRTKPSLLHTPHCRLCDTPARACRNDGECDESDCTGSNCSWGLQCDPGSDTADCGGGSHDNSCRYANDGECDEPNFCTTGTDCSDCGNCGGHRRLHITEEQLELRTELPQQFQPQTRKKTGILAEAAVLIAIQMQNLILLLSWIASFKG